MTPRATFYQKPTLQAVTLQTHNFAPLTRWHRDLQKGKYPYQYIFDLVKVVGVWLK